MGCIKYVIWKSVWSEDKKMKRFEKKFVSECFSRNYLNLFLRSLNYKIAYPSRAVRSIYYDFAKLLHGLIINHGI